MIWNGESILYFKSLKAINTISLEIALSILPNLRYTLLPGSVQLISHETLFFSHNKLAAARLSTAETISRTTYVWKSSLCQTSLPLGSHQAQWHTHIIR
jgi:hypothetical protein